MPIKATYFLLCMCSLCSYMHAYTTHRHAIPLPYTRPKHPIPIMSTAAPILLPYRSHIPNPTIPYRSSKLLPYRSNTAPIPSHTALCIAYGVWHMAPYCKQYRAIPVWMKYWSSLSNTRAIPQFFVTGSFVYYTVLVNRLT